MMKKLMKTDGKNLNLELWSQRWTFFTIYMSHNMYWMMSPEYIQHQLPFNSRGSSCLQIKIKCNLPLIERLRTFWVRFCFARGRFPMWMTIKISHFSPIHSALSGAWQLLKRGRGRNGLSLSLPLSRRGTRKWELEIEGDKRGEETGQQKEMRDGGRCESSKRWCFNSTHTPMLVSVCNE